MKFKHAAGGFNLLEKSSNFYHFHKKDLLVKIIFDIYADCPERRYGCSRVMNQQAHVLADFFQLIASS